MKKHLVTCLLSFIAVGAFAQIPEDALKYTWNPVNGTARANAIGGAMGSLGGDLTSIFTNPAGLAMFKTTDLVISPGFNFLSNRNNFRGTNAKATDAMFNLGTTGFVGGLHGNRSWTNSAISFAVTRTANFSNKIRLTGANDFSSFGEQYAAEAAFSGQSIDEMLGSNSNVSLGTRMALYNYFVDTASIGGATPDFISLAMYDALKNGGNFLVNQTQTIETSGGITELAIGYAANKNDKFYLGGSIGIPIVQYEKNSVLREEDATGNPNNNFNFAELSETYKTKGFGVNAKLGIIVKPTEQLRLGLTIHTPTVYALTDSYFGTLSSDLDTFRTIRGTDVVNSNQFTGNQTPQYDYDLNSPWKFMVSGAYVLHEVADVRQQRGFITGEAEYVTYKSNRFKSADGQSDDYFAGVNEATRAYYRNAVNFRVGGEIKFTTLMGRLGFAYYGSPYSDKELKANKTYFTGGLGYRNGGMFIDVSYAHSLQKDVNFPYRLPDKANTYSTMKTTGGNLMLTLGFKI